VEAAGGQPFLNQSHEIRGGPNQLFINWLLIE
jgi:hypothetical protein